MITVALLPMAEAFRCAALLPSAWVCILVDGDARRGVWAENNRVPAGDAAFVDGLAQLRGDVDEVLARGGEGILK